MQEVTLSMQDVQQESLQILRKVDEICNKLNIKYFLAYGTLIGAIRHQGFIPWDDDLDIIMLRKDYDIFLSYFMEHPEELKPLRLFCPETCPEYPYTIARVSDDKYILAVDNEKSYGIGAFIDIYPYDNMFDSYEASVKLSKKSARYASLCYLSTRLKCKKERTKGKLKLLIKYPAFLLAHLLGKNFFFKKLRKNAASGQSGDCQYIGCLVWGTEKERGIFKSELFREAIDVPFEGYTFKAPKEYDTLLRQIYGDYMQLPPEEQRIGHHFYKAYLRK